MKAQEKVEREINLKELFWQILFGWRMFICFGVVFAVLLGGVKYKKDFKNYQTSQQEIDLESIENELTEKEIQEVQEAKRLMERIEEYENYLENSALMHINLYEKPVVELQYYIDSDYTFNYTQENENDYTNDLMNQYVNYIVSGKMGEKVIKEANLAITQVDVSELWTISQVGNSILIKFTCPDAQKMNEVAKSIESLLKKKETEFQEIGSHKLKLLGESQNVVVDTGLIDRKNSILNNISALNSQLKTIKANLTDSQLNLLKSEQESTKNDESKDNLTPRINFKYMILGAILGIFIVCALIVCKMLFTVKLQNSEDIYFLYNTRLLGEIYIPKEKKGFLSIIDNKLWELKNRKRKKLTIQQQVKIVAASIALFYKQKELKCIYITGSEYESLDKCIIDMLKKELFLQNVEIKEGGNILYDTESLKLGTEIKNIIFIEQIGQSIYDEISNELNLAREQNNDILGIIVLA